MQSHATPAPYKTDHLEMVKIPSRTQVTSLKHPDLKQITVKLHRFHQKCCPINIDILAPHLFWHHNYSHGPYIIESLTSGFKLEFLVKDNCTFHQTYSHVNPEVISQKIKSGCIKSLEGSLCRTSIPELADKHHKLCI